MYLRICALSALVALSASPLCAQAGFFNFTPPANTNIVVNGSCLGSVAMLATPPTVTSTVGATITTSQFSPANTYLVTDLWPAPGSILVKWRVADNMGHIHDFEFGVNWIDGTPPVFDISSVPSPLLLGSIAQLLPQVALPVSDNCPNIPSGITQMFSQTGLIPPLCEPGNLTRTWVATDIAGNTTTYIQIIKIFRDSVPPTVTGNPVNGSAPCSALPGAYTSWLAAQMANFTATDNSGIASYTNNAPPSLAACPIPVTVTFKVTDNCGVTATRTASFSSTDTQPPTVNIVPKDTIAYCTSSAAYLAKIGEFIHTHGYSNVTDPCSPTLTWTMLVNGATRDSLGVIADLQASFANPCGVQLIGSQSFAKVRGYVPVNFFATDICGNQVFVGLAEFAVVDTTGPTITGPATTFEECGSSNDQTVLQAWINNHGTASITDACSTPSWTNFSFTTSNGQSGNGSFNAGPYPVIAANDCNWFTDVTFRAADDCGNSSSKTLRFRIRDTTKPLIGGFVDSTKVYCPSPIPTTFTATVFDNCATGIIPTYTVQYADTVCVGNYSIRVYWTAVDPCGNTGTRTQTILVRDTIGPVFVLVPAATTASCDNWQTLPLPVIGTAVTATDACGQVQGITIASSNNQNPNINLCSHYNFNLIRTFTARDVCGNTRTATQLITVQDLQVPTAGIALPDTIIPCQNLPLNPATPPAIDNCSPIVGPVVLNSQTIVGGSCPDSYTIVVTWRATDVCGNTGFFSRNFLVRDTIRPSLSNIPADITVDCEGIPAPPVFASLNAADNCDNAPVVTYLQTDLRDPNPANCAHWSNYPLRREWTATDACGNHRTYTQIISVMDNTGPVLIVPDTILLPAAPGQCSANILPPTPYSVYDVCSSLPFAVTLRDTVPITGPPLSTVPCDTVFLLLNAPNLPPNQPIVNAGSLTVFLDSTDAEGPTEFFYIYGENGVLLGKTTPTATQCGNGSTLLTISENDLNDWFTDGQLVLTLVPNDTNVNAINPICPGRSVRAELNYQYEQPQLPVTVTYRIDGGSVLTFPTTASTQLNVGTHTVVYTASDCAGNTSVATAIVRIDDIEPPLITAPATQTAYVLASNCVGTQTLPFPGISENCTLSGAVAQNSAVVSVQFENNPNISGKVPKMMTITVGGLIPQAVSNGILKIRYRGDNGNAGEFFKVYDESVVPVQLTSTTQSAPGVECVTFHETQIIVTAAQINAWAANGVAQFKLIANTDVINFADFINPCGPVNGAGFDGISAAQVELDYNYAVVNYSIANSAGNIVQSGLLNASSTNTTLSPGNYTVTYTTTDIAANLGQTTYNLIVRDTIRPVAKCQNIIINTSVTGNNPYTLTAAEINNGSIDNCSGTDLTFALSQSNFTCNQANQIIPVTLTVIDTSGNSSNCVAMVRVETETISTSFLSNICEGGTAQIYCDPPGNDANYTYSWTGPGMYTSMVQNPSIPNAQLSQEGTYLVQVTGPTGCKALGEVQLQLIGLPVQPAIIASNLLICAGQNVTLNTAAYNGTNVSYEWYEGNITTIIATTLQPTLTLPNLPAGIHLFWVRVVDNNCKSASSAPTQILVQGPPVGSVLNSNISVCEGELIVLGTAFTGNNIDYLWTGPFVGSILPYPEPFVATLSNSGTYTLTIHQNGCPGVPVTVQVEVRDRPDAPSILAPAGVCEGSNIVLSALPLQGDAFGWISPNADTTLIAGINSLTLSNITQTEAGNWRVFVVQNGCVSPLSPAHNIDIDPYPVVEANANTPLCQGTTLLLHADANAIDLTYKWTGPENFVAFTKDATDITPTTGDYIIEATSPNGCSSYDTISVNFVIPPVITAVTSNAPTCVDGTNDIQLFNTIFPTGVYTYNWTSSTGFQSTAQFPVIPTVDLSDNGSYCLVVTDAYGCVSLPACTTLNVNMVPPTPVLLVPAAVCETTDVDLMLQNGSVYNGSFFFNWTGPTTTITNQPSLSIINAVAQNSGLYSVTAINANGTCFSASSNQVELTVHPTPSTPAILTNSPVCAGDTLYFDPGNAGGIVDEWIWSGPTNFNPGNIENPIRFPVVLNDAGQYSLRIRINGCLSAPGEPTFVIVKPQPNLPIAAAELNICKQQADTLTLQVAGGQTPGAQYQWFDQFQQPVSQPGFSPVFNLTDFSGIAPGFTSFYVQAFLDGCESAPSALKSVKFDTIPNIMASAGTDYIACVSFPLFLSAQPPQLGAGSWTQVAGAPLSIVEPNNPMTNVEGALQANTTYQFVWTISNGGCKNYDADTLSIPTVEFAQADVAIDRIDTCFANSVQLHAIQNVVAAGYWTQPQSQSMFNPPVVITDPNDPNTTVTGLTSNESNIYYFYWNINSSTCGNSVDSVVVRTYVGNTPFDTNYSVCDDAACVEITGSSLKPFETGTWTSVSGGIAFSPSPNSRTVTTCNLKEGNNIFTWQTNQGICGAASSSQVVVVYEKKPIAVLDNYSLSFGTQLDFVVTDNDLLPAHGQYTVTLISPPSVGTITKIDDKGRFIFVPPVYFEGTDRLIYQLCNDLCESNDTSISCSRVNAIFTGSGSSECLVPTLITPNGDGINDEWFIPCLSCGDCQSDNDVSVFNEWGDLVFHEAPYSQNWRGTYNGDPLPPGTYFYIVQYNTANERKPEKGFLIIQR